MAEDLERWTPRTPARRHVSDGVLALRQAADVEQQPPEPPPRQRERGPFLTYLAMPWSYGDRDTGERWRRWQCRWGRHEMHGGHTMQLDGSDVFIERRCRWCDTEPGEMSRSARRARRRQAAEEVSPS